MFFLLRLGDPFLSQNYNYYLLIFEFSTPASVGVSHSRTFLSILTDLNNVVVWMVSTRPLISKSSSPSINPLETVPRAPITIGISVTFMFYSFFQFLCKVQILILFAFFQFYSGVRQDSKIQNSASSLFCCCCCCCCCC